MSVSKRFNTLYEQDGIEYVFNKVRFREVYQNVSSQWGRGSKTRIVRLLAEKVSLSESAVKGWIAGNNGVSDIEIVNVIEDFFDLKRGDLLMPRCEPNEEENRMREISSSERDAAREAYCMLVKMIDGLTYENSEISQAGGWASTIQGFKYLGPTNFPFVYRDDLILKIRQLGFDLPSGLRDRLIELINEPYDKDCGELGMLYLSSESYRAYLEKNQFEDSQETKELYSCTYVRDLYERLDRLFEDYLVS